MSQIDDAIIASVVPDATPRLKEAIRAVTGNAPLIVGAADVDLGIAVNIDHPAQAGADRLVNAVGAMAHHHLPAILLISEPLQRLIWWLRTAAMRAIIAPGVALSIEALERAAAQLPRLELRSLVLICRFLGKIMAAMETGVLWGYVGMIEGLLRRLREEQGGSSRLPAIATGGLAGLFADHLPDIDAVDPDLTIRGLFEIYARNRGTRRAVGN